MRLFDFYGLFAAYLLYEEVMSVRLYVLLFTYTLLWKTTDGNGTLRIRVRVSEEHQWMIKMWPLWYHLLIKIIKLVNIFTPSFKCGNVGYRPNALILKLKFRALYVLEATNNYCHREKTQIMVCYGCCISCSF